MENQARRGREKELPRLQEESRHRTRCVQEDERVRREQLLCHRGNQSQSCQRRNHRNYWAKDVGRRLFLSDICLLHLQCRQSEVDLRTSIVDTLRNQLLLNQLLTQDRSQCLEEDQVDHGKSLYILNQERKRPLSLNVENLDAHRKRRLISRVRRHLNQHRVEIVHSGELKLLHLLLLKIPSRLVIRTELIRKEVVADPEDEFTNLRNIVRAVISRGSTVSVKLLPF
ncbi:MAG: hypothetical protein AAFV95_29045 [Bacteroidota bacterium]